MRAWYSSRTGSPAGAAQLRLDRPQQIVGFVLLQIGWRRGHPELVGVDDRKPGKSACRLCAIRSRSLRTNAVRPPLDRDERGKLGGTHARDVVDRSVGGVFAQLDGEQKQLEMANGYLRRSQQRDTGRRARRNSAASLRTVELIGDDADAVPLGPAAAPVQQAVTRAGRAPPRRPLGCRRAEAVGRAPVDLGVDLLLESGDRIRRTRRVGP